MINAETGQWMIVTRIRYIAYVHRLCPSRTADERGLIREPLPFLRHADHSNVKGTEEPTMTQGQSD